MDAGAYLDFAKKGFKEAVRGVGALAQTIADEGGTLIAGSKALKDYKLVSSSPVASSGSGDCWKIYDASCQKPHGESKVQMVQ